MGRGFDMPWVKGSTYYVKEVKIPLIGGSKYHC
jgi:hypothetical protein